MNRNKNFIKKDILNQLIKKSDMVVYSNDRRTVTFVSLHDAEGYDSFTVHLIFEVSGNGLIITVGRTLFERYSKFMSFPLNLIEETILELFHGVEFNFLHVDQGRTSGGFDHLDREDPYEYLKKIHLSL